MDRQQKTQGAISRFSVSPATSLQEADMVYAVEASSMVQHTEELVRQNGCEGQERAENLTLPEKVDVLVSEWMANCLLV
ncbi:Protein arginine N-methyltransferase 2 [Triplophysa tibetana]|uniref:Protein arginine N-methyltransferase 2 n=1 Tax=Triplophysa tibetana TaxID=1572043 RepID=A0A5A9P2K5_9TELE|nr:Protein arginine N-methyltransferase 2 [Triplophysa tibetana]